MTPAETQCAMILQTACSAPFGIVVHTNDALRARAVFYRVRKTLGDVSLKEIQIRVSPDDSEHELWLVRKPQGPEFALLGLTHDESIL